MRQKSNTRWILVSLGLMSVFAVGSSSKADSETPNAVDWIGPSLGLAKFVDPLPIPPRVQLPDAKTGSGGNNPYVMEASQFAHQFHRDLPPTQVWSYNKSFPGPTLEVLSKQGVKVQWLNHLPNLPLIKTQGGMLATRNLPPVRTTVHLHGGSVPEVGFSDRHHNSDGWPDSWNVPGDSQVALYPNTQESATLWYHDHTTAITALNVYSGLAGLYLIRDAYEKSLKLPSDAYEIPLVIQARSFKRDGSMYYPPKVATEFYGNTNVVNGKVTPYLVVEPRKYRFRVLNASNARTYSMKLLAQQGQPGPAFYQIGSEGGLLEQTVVLNDPADPVSKRLVLAPGERADIIVDFSSAAGKSFLLHNDSQTDDEALEVPLPEVMEFRVAAQTKGPDLTQLPMHFRPIPRLKESEAKRSRTIVLKEVDYPDGSQMLLINDRHWDDPIVEKPLLNSVEVWNVVNATEDAHPFHIHLVEFQVVSRQPFDAEKYKATGQIAFSGDSVPPEPGELGWKDTVRASPGAITKIIMRFGPYPGHFVYHCHILEHEDMDMMRPFEVVTQPALTDPDDRGAGTRGFRALTKFLDVFGSFFAEPSNDRSPASHPLYEGQDRPVQ